MSEFVDKVYVYITHGDRLLVFTQPEAPEAGVQVPGGSIDPGEAPAAAAMREAFEETGLENLHMVAALGECSFDAQAFGAPLPHRRFFYHLVCKGRPPERWRHYERHRSDGIDEPIAFDLYWVALGGDGPELVAEMGALLGRLGHYP
jgi:8-oxo-dGTP pyrophosphatase MutT (NUDIX family)